MGVFKATFKAYPGGDGISLPESHQIFGCIISALLALVSLAFTLLEREPNPIPLMLGACCLLLVIWSPQSFKAPYMAWKTATLATGKFVTMLIWLFYILPSGLLMQARGRDPLELRFNAKERSYWRTPLPVTSMQRSA